MQSLIVCLLMGAIIVNTQQSNCRCRIASAQDMPHGANEVLEYNLGEVRQIKGRVLYATGEPIPEAVVEVYRYSNTNKDLDAYNLAKVRERQTACITDTSGGFCFKDLPPGQYALKVGTREPDGMNEAYVKVGLGRKRPTSKGIEIVLTPGT